MSYRAIALFAALLLPACGFGQTADRLGSVSKLFVGSFGDKPGAAALRDSFAARLSKSHGMTVVTSAGEADAVVTGNGEVWIKGHFSLNPRQREINSDSQTVHGGYLSVEIKGAKGETLWSYLVTPQKGITGDIHKDLANHVVKKLLDAIAEEKKSP